MEFDAVASKKLTVRQWRCYLCVIPSQLYFSSGPNVGPKDGEMPPVLLRSWRGEQSAVRETSLAGTRQKKSDTGAARRAQNFSSEAPEGKGRSKVTALRRNDSKHKGIYIQIFKHSWKDAWTEIPFLCSPCRNEFNTQPDANAKWLKLFLASIAKLPLFVKRIEFSCGYSSWLHSASICTLFFF